MTNSRGLGLEENTTDLPINLYWKVLRYLNKDPSTYLPYGYLTRDKIHVWPSTDKPLVDIRYSPRRTLSGGQSSKRKSLHPGHERTSSCERIRSVGGRGESHFSTGDIVYDLHETGLRTMKGDRSRGQGVYGPKCTESQILTLKRTRNGNSVSLGEGMTLKDCGGETRPYWLVKSRWFRTVRLTVPSSLTLR